jgi:hypothetical protein
MLSKAKDTAVSFVQDVFDKRNSLDSKPESAALSSSENIASLMSSPNQLSTSSSLSSLDKDTYDKVLGHKKHYSLPIRRPFTIRKDDSQDSSAPSLDSAAAAEAAILSGVERPGHFATACDFRLASEKRNEEFHALFKSVEVSDLLIQG